LFAQLFKKFRAFCENWRFIIGFTRACRCLVARIMYHFHSP
jgi:hypothetical protein